ncbi:unnamed protein product [Rhizophagus irregularis]|nr:unnamed protein product [Rhizophagus irregularis]
MESIVITKMMITKYEEFNKNSIQLPRLFAGGAKTTSIIAFFYENIIYRHGCPRELLRSSFCKRIVKFEKTDLLKDGKIINSHWKF